MARASSPTPERQISAEAAKFYADVYRSARSGCLTELRRAGCPADEAEEFFAAALEKVMRSVDPVARDFTPAKMVAFLKVASVRALIDERRHRAVLSQVTLEKVEVLVTAPHESPPDEVAEDHELVAIGREAIGVLGRRDRHIFSLRNSLGLSPREVRACLPGLTDRSYRRRIERSNARVAAAFDKIVDGRRCGEVQALLRTVEFGTLKSGEADEIRLHVAHCAGCRRIFSGMNRRRRRRASAGPP